MPRSLLHSLKAAVYTRTRGMVLLGVSVGYLGAPCALEGQAVVTLEDRDSCTDCRIQMRRLLTIGDSIGPGIVDGEDHIWSIDSDGRMYHTGYHIAPEIRVFGPNGRFLELLGRDGSGPGEFRGRSTLFIGAGDTLRVFNWGNRAYSIFGPDRRLVRVHSAPLIPTSVLESPSGELIAAGLLRLPGARGYPLHRLERTGGHISSFGALEPYGGIRTSLLARNLVADRSANSFFSLNRYRFSVEEWTWSGSLVRTFVAEPSWFAPLKPESGPDLPLDGTSPLAAVLVGGRIAEGMLWLVFNVPDPKWPDAFHVYGQPSVHGIEPSKIHMWDSMIVVIDLARETIIKRARTSRWITGMVGGHAVVQSEAGLGHPLAEIWSLHLVR